MSNEEKAARAQAAGAAIGVTDYDRASEIINGSADVMHVEDS